MVGNTFVTIRGDRISLAFGRRPTVGRTGSGPYPRVDEVCQEHGIFRTFSLLLSRLAMLFYPSHLLFSQFHSSRKDKTRAIDRMM